MIKSLSLQNFQSHKNTKLKFVEGVNAIIGTTDSGKSSIIRAMNLVINNKPSGNEFINNKIDKKDSCIVNLETDNCIVTREKNDRTGKNLINRYIINNEELKAVGQNVPEEVKKGLNFNELNIQYQIDSPFLISETPGEIARVFNRVVDLDIIDTSLSRSESEKRSINSNIKLLATQVEHKKEDLKLFDSLPDMDRDLKLLENWDVSIKSETEKHNILIDILEEKDLIKKNLKNPILKAGKKVDYLISIQSEKQNRDYLKIDIEGLVNDYYLYYRQVKKQNRLLKAEKEIGKILDIENRTHNSGIKLNNISVLINQLKNATKGKNNKLAVLNIDKFITLEQGIFHTGVKKVKLLEIMHQYFKYKNLLKNINVEQLEKEFHAMLPDKCSPDICPLLNGGNNV